MQEKVVWKGFSDHFKEALSNTSDYADVTLVSEDNKHFRSHRVVMSSCSRVMRKILRTMADGDQVVLLTGIRSEVVTSMLQYMYTGETVLHPDRVSDFLEAAKDLDIGDVRKNILSIPTDENIEEVQLDSDDEDVIEEISVVDDIKTNQVSESKHLVIKESFSLNPSESLNRLPAAQTSALFDFTMSNTCPECGTQFTSSIGMKSHFKMQHSGVKFPCNRCEYVAKGKELLKKHLMKVHETHQCTFCSFKTVGNRSLWSHIKSRHSQKEINRHINK